MAKDKRSFVLYADYLETVSKLPDNKAGRLFKLILEYVNDKNPTTDDLLLQVAFEPIKQQLKRDLKQWEQQLQKRSEAGKLGGIESGKIRRSKTKQSEAKRSNASKNEANEADNVTVTVNVTDTVTNKRAKALVADESAPGASKKDYDLIVEEIKGKDINTVVAALKEFLQKKPAFIDPYIDYWNVAATGTNLPQVKQATESRTKQFRVRMKEESFDFVEIIKRVRASNKLKNESSWFSFDWIFINDKNYIKILEGNYQS